VTWRTAVVTERELAPMIETVPSLSDIDADRSEQMHYRARGRVRSSGASARRNTKAKEIIMSATDAADVDVKM
jgi:hypothetical protein